jgi:hypothetical protein
LWLDLSPTCGIQYWQNLLAPFDREGGEKRE